MEQQKKRHLLQMLLLAFFIFLSFGFFEIFLNNILVKINLEKILNDYANNMNNECPVELNSELVMDKVIYVKPKLIIYENIILNYRSDDLNIIKLKENMSEIVKSEIESLNSLSKIRNNNVRFEYIYFDKNRVKLFSLKVLYNTPLEIDTNN